MIEVEGLSKSYGPTPAVRDMTFAVKPGRVTGFLGPNGAGKSTAMRLMIGLDRPDSGAARVLGRPYGGHSYPLHQVGALLDAGAVQGGRRARQHLTWLARSNRIPVRRVEAVLEQVGLSEVAHRRLRGFSLGMRQRLGIAAALLGDPAVLLFDEPINGLDPEGIQWIRELTRGFAREGRTVFVSSHLMSEMQLTADHLIIVGRGQVVADAGLAELIAASGASYVSVRSPEPARLQAVLAAARIAATADADGSVRVRGVTRERIGDLAAEHGITLHELAARDVSLETAFFELTGDQTDYAGQPAASVAGESR